MIPMLIIKVFSGKKGLDPKIITEPLPEIIETWKEEDSTSYVSLMLPALRCTVDFNDDKDTIEITLPKEYPFKAGDLTSFLNEVPDTLVFASYPAPGLSTVGIKKLPNIVWSEAKPMILASLFKNWEMSYIK